ncbi:hypothetical protein [Halomarina pelagica]|uniref:hypothetical protein n=1 Tax=Halomarina pelagica TaxID=2961599 RepID=UPI0020C5225A|nr:hypothetical protein [Halomarina sp. BND7]
MERGTEYEERAICQRWQTLEHQRRQADRLALGIGLLLVGVVSTSLGLLAPLQACIVGGTRTLDCAPALVSPLTQLGFTAGGGAMGCVGIVLCWLALSERN